MKRITFLLAILFATQMAFAQEEVAIEQNINQRIKKLEINPGWDVHLIHHEADSGYRVAIITDEDLAARAYNVQLCNVKDQTLTIFENTQLPQGTVVEIEGPMNFGQLRLLDRATAEADYLVASEQKDLINLCLCRNSSLHVQHYHIPNPDNSPCMDVWDHAKLTIDTISGEGDAVLKVYGADFQYATNTLQGKITLNEYETTNDWHYQPKDSRIIKTKQVNGEWVTTDHRMVWNNAIHVDASFGYRMGGNPTNANSPLLNNGTLSVNLGLATYFQLSNRLGLRTGIQWNTDTKYLSHQVKYEDNALVVIDGQGVFQRNSLKNHYIGVPVSLNYYLGRQQTESFSLDLFCGYLMGERLRTSADLTRGVGFGWTGENVDNIFNPWKLEAGLSFNTQHLGFIHGIRVFTNLLPEYKPRITTDKFRTVGVEIKL